MKSHIAKPVVAIGLGMGVWEYLEAYDGGYRDGMMGTLPTYCFRPEPETRGAEDGALAGMRLWFRMMGRRTPERSNASTGRQGSGESGGLTE